MGFLLSGGAAVRWWASSCPRGVLSADGLPTVRRRVGPLMGFQLSGGAFAADGGHFAAFPCRFACCFLAFCAFSPVQARKMRLFLCKREGVFGSRRQCPRDRAPLSRESPRVLNVGVSKIGKTMQINEAGIMGSTCPPYTNKKEEEFSPMGCPPMVCVFVPFAVRPVRPVRPVRLSAAVRLSASVHFLICIWAFLI